VKSEGPVFIAAGSNVEAPRNLSLALDELEREFGTLTLSNAYRNRAHGFDGPDFINMVVGFRTALGVREIMQRLHGIEAHCGRQRGASKWESRSMDLDILLYGDLVCDEPGLTLPRPDLLRRAYMLGPLAEIAPELKHPTAKRTIGELWSEFDRTSHPLERVELTRGA
jgi:2-amino-4-hydroxy-6-hydroxymethyldihydropteridine diphosphokinase